MPIGLPTRLGTLPAAWRDDRLVCSEYAVLEQAQLVQDEDALLVLVDAPDGARVAGYGPNAGDLIRRLAVAGELPALSWLSLPR